MSTNTRQCRASVLFFHTAFLPQMSSFKSCVMASELAQQLKTMPGLSFDLKNPCDGKDGLTEVVL